MDARLRKIFRRELTSILIAAALLVFPALVPAQDESLEKELQQGLSDSIAVVKIIQHKLRLGAPVSSELDKLKSLADNLRITDLLLRERIKISEEKAKTLGAKALGRQQTMTASYGKAIKDYLAIIESLSFTPNPQSELNNLQVLLDKLVPKKKLPLIGSLPYKHPNLPSQQPSTAPEIVPAYKGGNKTVGSADTANTAEAPVSAEISGLAQSLNWNPVSIYEYVKNNIGTEWYWGCMKGAQETLSQKSGNDCDQATLLAALLRASGYPTRYVRGTIEFLPNIDRVKNLTGIDDPLKIAEFFQKAGIPYTPVVAGGGIANFQIEHIWVESRIPYANYRGAIIDEHGKTWLGLDTSIKVKGYEYKTAKDVFQETGVRSQLESLRNEYLGQVQTLTPLEYLNNKIDNDPSGTLHSEYQRTRAQIPEIMNILPAGLQFTELGITNEYTAIPEELKHKVRIIAASFANAELLNHEFDVMQLSNQQVILSYEPETVEDQEIINSYAGLDNTPAYLIRLKPVLKVNGERIAAGTEGLPMGADYDLTMELTGPAPYSEKIINTMITGNLTAIGIVAGKAIAASAPLGSEGAKSAEEILYNETVRYIDRWNKSEEELAPLFHLAITRPLPTVATIGGVIDVTYLLDMPHGFTWKGVYLDADLRTTETVRGKGSGVRGEAEKLFMQLSSLQGSVLEHRLFEDDFKVESISTAKLIQLVSGQQSAADSQLVNIDKSNVNTLLPTLDLDDNIKEDIANSVNRNFIIRFPSLNSVPLTTYTYHDWSGIGYIKENSETGESGWMLSGMIAGGSTVTKEWLDNLLLMQVLSTPYEGPKNLDPLAGAGIHKIPATDNQPEQTVNEILNKPLAVAVVDRNGLPVAKAAVTFHVAAGGGELQCLDEQGNPIGQPSDTKCDTQTSSNTGIARAKLRLGKKTGANPVYRAFIGQGQDNYPTQIGKNLVNASVISYSGTLYLDRSFEEYGKPDVPVKIDTVAGNGNVAVVNTSLGTLISMVTDTHGNPISNVTVTFAPAEGNPLPLPGTAPPLATCWTDAICRNVTFYAKETCTASSPLYGECNTILIATVKTDYNGARIEAMAGNTVGTQYTVNATAAGVAAAANFVLKSDGMREEASVYIPSGIRLGIIENVDTSGNRVNAAKAGSKLKPPLEATLYQYSDVVSATGPIDCTIKKQQTKCWEIAPTGAIKTIAVTGATVTFAPTAGNGKTTGVQEPLPGMYVTSFTTGTIPAINKITAKAEASVEVPEIYYDSITKKYLATYVSGTTNLPKRNIIMKSGQIYEFDILTGEPTLITAPDEQQAVEYTVYGVGITLVAEPKILFVDDQGFTTKNRTFTYTVTPPEYNALSADIDFFTKDAQNLESWDGYLTCDKKQGTGMEILSAGEATDVTVRHYAQVTLNWGTDLEIKGDSEPVRMAQLNIKADDPASAEAVVDEIKFSGGSKASKRYKLELKSADLAESCADAAVLTGTIKTILKSGETAPAPGADFNPTQYSLAFSSIADGCSMMVNGKANFIVSNRSKTDLDHLGTVSSDTAALYGGLGNRSLIELSGAKKEVPIEPVGVIVLGIDGLRQDVLYPPQVSSVETVTASYSDPTGCGGSCYVQPAELKGLCDVLGGKYSSGFLGFGSGCNTEGMENKHIKLKDVTAIFPSITLASWASIFTGKMPGETGILGNEFFARDLSVSIGDQKRISVPQELNNPPGIISLSSGAFEGYDEFGLLNGLLTSKFFVPYQLDWEKPVDPMITPQNNRRVLLPDTVYESIAGKNDDPNSGMTGVKGYFNQKGGDPVVVVNNHYARGAYWLTWDIEIAAGESQILDQASWDKFDDYLGGKYISYDANSEPYRNKTPFSALTVWYLPGLDHDAHGKGMGIYRNYFKNTTDDKINKVVARLKDLDEFENKIFIITADHGHTAMPEKFKYMLPVKTFDASDTPTEVIMEFSAEPSCKLNLDFGGADEPDAKAIKTEQANNNLHIWELGETLRALQEKKPELQYNVLAPGKIAELFIDTPAGARRNLDPQLNQADYANVVAAFNGPMAHIYLRGQNGWQNTPNPEELKKFAEVLRVLYQVDDFAEAQNALGMDMVGYLNLLENTIGRLKRSVDKMLIRIGGAYMLFEGYVENGYVITPMSLGSKYIKATERITGLNHPQRSGDIVLIMNDGTAGLDLNRYTTGVACKSWHGSLNASDSYVPFVVAYPGGSKHEITSLIDSTQGCNATSGCDGNWRASDLIKTIIQQQYVSQ